MERTDNACFAQAVRRTSCFGIVPRSRPDALHRTADRVAQRSVLRSCAAAALFLFTAVAQSQVLQIEGTQLASVSAPAGQPAAGASTPRVEALLDRLPLAFEANAGQFDERAKYRVRGHGQDLFLAVEGMVLVLEKPGSSDPLLTIVRLEFKGGARDTEFAGLDRLPAITNYFSAGRNITDVPNFARVRQLGVYPGIDVIYYGNQGRLEYDFMIFPGADVNSITLRLRGHEAASISDSGDLILATRAGELKLHKPVAYQEIDGQRNEVAVRYLLAEDRIQFQVGDYNRSRPLIIDPILSYSTYLGGGTDDTARAIAIDANGNVYIVGETNSTDFPLANALQTKKQGSYDVFVTKMNAGGSGLVYSTYIGGKQGSSFGWGIAVDAAGHAYITGRTTTTSYPVTSDAYQTTKGSTDAGFITKLSPQGNALVYSTYVRGAPGAAIALDTDGNAFITGDADSAFATAPGAFQPTAGGTFPKAYAVKLNATGTGVHYATYLGGSGNDSGRGIAVDAAGNAYITGIAKSADFPLANPFQSTLGGTQDAFVTKLNAAGSALVYSTYLGGSLRDSGHAIALDSQGNAYVAGDTYSANFPVFRAFQPNKAFTGSGHQGLNQAFITKFNPSGSALIYSSYLGGQGCLGPGIFSCQPKGDEDGALAIAVDAAGNAYIAGYARSIVFPQVDLIQQTLTPYGNSIPFVAKVQDLTNATLVYSAAIGRKDTAFYTWAATGIAVDTAGNAYVTGYFHYYAEGVFPTTPGAFQTNSTLFVNIHTGFVFKVSPGRFTTSLTTSNFNPTSADTVTLTATVGSAVPGGNVTFASNGNSLGSAPVSQSRATLGLSLPAGVHELTAVYSGDNKVSRPLFLPVRQALICN
jgi:hypothetical protein